MKCRSVSLSSCDLHGCAAEPAPQPRGGRQRSHTEDHLEVTHQRALTPENRNAPTFHLTSEADGLFGKKGPATGPCSALGYLGFSSAEKHDVTRERNPRSEGFAGHQSTPAPPALSF
ncbi:hypothetical protein SKAU_G00198160 [Synaphobranchus kaupii]|uniref:Uncharacterized protein n=1 Tax=Synaphobranchus kaupii TaxID=118154 RepID=A0A9Q1IVV3_SYNKA|nr:hypothetical protein SKAU_G00198160 [Synaphobranchus kaupii]